MTKEPTFKIGEEAISKITGERGYIVNSFRACVVNFGKIGKVIPEENLVKEGEELLDRPLFDETKDIVFSAGDIVRFIPTEKKVIIGTVVDSKWFYIFHLHKTGELKVVLAGMLVKGNVKIIPFVPLKRVIINPKDLPGQKRFPGVS